MLLLDKDDLTISKIVERSGPVRTADAMFPKATPEAIARALTTLPGFTYEAGTEKLVINYQTFVLRTGGATILIDTCIGDHPEYPEGLHYDKQPWLDGLAASGLSFEDIDYVCCTHLHIDHVGWNTRLLDGRIVPTFPNAKYIFARREYEEFSQNLHPAVGPSLDLCVTPIVEAGQALLVEDGFEITDGIRLMSTPGHSPGHLCIRVASREQEILFSGDIMHHAIQCIEPDWSTIFCWDQDMAARARRTVLEDCADRDVLVIPAHFPGSACGRIRSSGTSFRFEFAEI